MPCAFAQSVELPRGSTQSDNHNNPISAMLSPEKDDDDWSYSSMKIMETNSPVFSFLDTSIDSVSKRSKPIGQIAVADGGTDSVVIGRS